jgi:hypothetical protein
MQMLTETTTAYTTVNTLLQSACTKMILPVYNETGDDTFATNVLCCQRLVVTAAPKSIDSNTVLLQ